MPTLLPMWDTKVDRSWLPLFCEGHCQARAKAMKDAILKVVSILIKKFTASRHSPVNVTINKIEIRLRITENRK
jgi:hypothetical protein